MKVRIIHAEGHAFVGSGFKVAFCGHAVLLSTPITRDHSKVTCKICLRCFALVGPNFPWPKG